MQTASNDTTPSNILPYRFVILFRYLAVWEGLAEWWLWKALAATLISMFATPPQLVVLTCLLVAADFPRLIPPPHYIREVVVARIRKLTGNPPTGTVRSEIFSAAMAEGLFKPKVSCTPNVQQ